MSTETHLSVTALGPAAVSLRSSTWHPRADIDVYQDALINSKTDYSPGLFQQGVNCSDRVVSLLLSWERYVPILDENKTIVDWRPQTSNDRVREDATEPARMYDFRAMAQDRIVAMLSIQEDKKVEIEEEIDTHSEQSKKCGHQIVVALLAAVQANCRALEEAGEDDDFLVALEFEALEGGF